MAIVAIVGRPNVGKSTLFNRLVGRRQAIVSDVPGTTRDSASAWVEWGEHGFTVVDTGGLELASESGLWPQIRAQVKTALAEADALVFLTDATDGVTIADREVANLLRRRRKPVVLAVNKVDNERRELTSVEFYELALGDPIPISAYHNYGIDHLVAAIAEHLPEPHAREEPSPVMRLAIVGRPNLGKSLLLNAILGDERALVSESPGTTRDAVDTSMTYEGEPVVLVDTAGIRRRGRIEPGIEKYSVLRALRAIQRANVALVILDASEPATAQDLHVAGYALEAYKGIVLVVNKWDLAEKAGMDQADYYQALRQRFRFIPYVPVRFTSALRREGIHEVMAAAHEVHQERQRWVPEDDLRAAIHEALAAHPPPSVGKRYLRITQPRQEAIEPPTFVFSVNDPNLLHFSYRRYLENRIREAFGFRGTHLRLVFRSKQRTKR